MSGRLPTSFLNLPTRVISPSLNTSHHHLLIALSSPLRLTLPRSEDIGRSARKYTEKAEKRNIPDEESLCGNVSHLTSFLSPSYRGSIGLFWTNLCLLEFTEHGQVYLSFGGSQSIDIPPRRCHV